MPDAPDTPEVPDELDESEVPAVPEVPDVPVVPDAPVLGCDGMPDCDPDCMPDEPDVLGWAGISCGMPEAPVLGCGMLDAPVLGCCMPGCALDGTPEAPVVGSPDIPEVPELEAPVPDCDVAPDCDCASAAEETKPRVINKAIFFFMVETSRNLE